MILGRMDRYITIQSVTIVQSDSGEDVEAFTAYAQVWAERRDMRGSERFTSAQVLPARVAVFLMPWVDGVRENMRILDVDGSTYEIKGIAEDMRRGTLEITGEAQNPAATI